MTNFGWWMMKENSTSAKLGFPHGNRLKQNKMRIRAFGPRSGTAKQAAEKGLKPFPQGLPPESGGPACGGRKPDDSQALNAGAPDRVGTGAAPTP
jgi:hypothetical protein